MSGRASFFLLVLVASCASTPKHAGPANAGAQEVFREMMMTYGTMASYEQNGVVRTVAKGEGKKEKVEDTPFHMTFARPDALDFAYGEHISLSAHGRAVTGGDGTNYASVDEAIRALSKSTLGVSRLVPSMLLGRGSYPWPEELWTMVRWERSEEISGEPCDVLAIDLSDGGQWTLWVEKDRHVLRKTTKSGHLDDGLLQAIVVYDPKASSP
jgi:hypothetical protein